MAGKAGMECRDCGHRKHSECQDNDDAAEKRIEATGECYEAPITVSGLVFPEVEPGLYQVEPGTLITRDALQDAVKGFLDRGGKVTNLTGGEKPWEPVEDLMVETLDSDCNYLKPPEDLEPGEHQKYGCTVIGFNLDDPEGCRSIIDITTGEGREADEELAHLIVKALRCLVAAQQMTASISATVQRNLQKNFPAEEKRPEGCPGDCQDHHGLCVGDEGEV